MKPEEIKSTLMQFQGSETCYRHCLGYVYTEGVKWMADTCGAHWLIDAIFSWQKDRKVVKDDRLQEFQLWVLKVKNGKAALICYRDLDDEAFRQEIGLTDFPLDEIRLYFEFDTLLLPQER